MNSWTGGTGASCIHSSYWHIYYVADLGDSQVFPSYVKRTQGVTKGGALARLKDRRQALAARTNLSES
jgi:hypothetical protein